MKLNIISYLSLFFLFLWMNSCSDKEFSKTEIHSVENNDSVQMKASLHEIMQSIEKGLPENAKSKAFYLNELAEKTNNRYYLGKVNSVFGYLHLIENRDDSAYFYYNKSKEYFSQIKDSLNTAKVLGNMAMIQADYGDYSGSELTAVDALKYLNEKDSVAFVSSIYNCLAISSYALKNNKEAIYWYWKALQSTSDPYSKKLYENNLAVSYIHLKDYSTAISKLNSLLVDRTVLKNPELKAKVIDNLAYASWKKYPDGNFEKEFDKARQIRVEHNDEWGLIASHSHLSEYFAGKNSGTALNHAKKMYEFATKLNSPDDRLEALQKLISLGSFDDSKQYAIIYTGLNDSLVTVRNQAKEQFAKIRFDSEKNRRDNQTLRLLDAENQIQVERQKNIKIIAIAGLIILGLTFIYFYFYQKNRRKREKLVAAYESEVRMSKKIHDVLSNDIYKFIIRLQNINTQGNLEKENLMSDIENIYLASREISRDFQDIDTKNNFNAEIKSLFASYQSDSVKIIYNLFEDDIWNKVDINIKRELYRVLQEIMTNMRKHSRAGLVLIQFKNEKDTFHIIYRDDGIGLPVNDSYKKSGLANMENRMESIKGSIIFESNPGKGLIVKIIFPLKN